MSAPPEEAYCVARSALYIAWQHRSTGITYGGGGLTSAPRLTSHMHGNIYMDDGAPEEMEASADATWSDKMSIYAILLTYMGATVAHTTKKINSIVDSSMGTEAIASSKATELIEYAREVLRALGVPPLGPTRLYTDNKANLLVASKIGNASRAKHLLRRYVAMQQRVTDGEVVLGKVDDAENPSDYLTKWVGKKKITQSDEYATNSRSAVKPKV